MSKKVFLGLRSERNMVKSRFLTVRSVEKRGGASLLNDATDWKIVDAPLAHKRILLL